MSRLRCTLHQCLGRGGFAEVYLASVRRSGGKERQVAIKVLRPNLDDPDEAHQRLKDEARLLATLNHPALPAAHGTARVEGRLAMVMEYCENRNLQDHINAYRKKGTRVSDRRTVRWTLEIAEVRVHQSANYNNSMSIDD